MKKKPRSEYVFFTGSHGDKLAARLELPFGSPKAFIIFAHCFACSKDIFAALRISQELTEHGFAVLRFDFTGLGASEGDFSDTNFSSNVEDVKLAAEFLQREYQAPKVLVGHSLGGTAVLAAATSLTSVEAVVTIGSPSQPRHVFENFCSSIEEIGHNEAAEVTLAGRKITIKKQFLDDAKQQDIIGSIGNLNKALLIFHSPADTIVPIAEARAIYQAAKHPKSFISLDKADHLLSRKADAIYVAQVIASWVTRYVESSTQAQDSDGLLDQETVIVTESGLGKYIQKIQAGPHTLYGDEPTKFGGDNAGFSPYQLLLAALGSCTSMTMRMYAEHKDIPLETIVVTLKQQKIHANDCENCESKNGKIDSIERFIRVTGDLTHEHRAGLMRIADRCPIHRTLTGDISIVTQEME